MAYKQIIIGRLELCDLPELGLTNLPIKVDTGAKTSSIHVDNIKEFDNNGVPFIGFDIHPDIHNVDTIVHCQSKVHDHRQIKSSNGSIEERYVIQTQMRFANEIWDIEVTLTDRSSMSYLMLLGRQGMPKGMLVDPNRSYLVDH